MNLRNTLFCIVFLVAAACAPAANSPTATLLPPQPTQESSLVPTVEQLVPAAEPTPTAESIAETVPQDSAPAAQSASAVAWLDLPITNARTGESFTLADFAGKTVFVEPMATWCTNCKRQLGDVAQVYGQLSADEYVFVSFSVGENVDNVTLANYADENGWNWIFAVASTELIAGMVSSFGRSVITPPSTPHFVILRDGSLSALSTGFESPDELLTQLTEASA